MRADRLAGNQLLVHGVSGHHSRDEGTPHTLTWV